ncbi:PolC-type DNA polymerase III [Candidatus Neomarinimicrobiota bacterium]
MTIIADQFVVFDLETTGFSPNDNEIIEIGAIKVDATERETFQLLVRPRNGIPSKITQITGISQPMVDESGTDIDSAIEQFVAFIGDYRLVAYNADFDMRFISAAGSRMGVTIGNDYACALKMARRAWPKLPNYKLSTLARLGGLTATGAHRALKDCELTEFVYTSAVAVLGSVK